MHSKMRDLDNVMDIYYPLKRILILYAKKSFGLCVEVSG